MDDPNPCVSSLVPDAANKPSVVHSLWQIILVIVLYLYGGLALLNGVIGAFMLLGGCCVRVASGRMASEAQLWTITLQMLVMAVHGALAVVAAWCFWKQCWKRGLALVAAAVVALVLIYVAACYTSHLPAGPEFPPRLEAKTQETNNPEPQQP